MKTSLFFIALTVLSMDSSFATNPARDCEISGEGITVGRRGTVVVCFCRSMHYDLHSPGNPCIAENKRREEIRARLEIERQRREELALKLAEEKALKDAQLAEEKRILDEKLAEEKRARDAQLAEEKRVRDQQIQNALKSLYDEKRDLVRQYNKVSLVPYTESTENLTIILDVSPSLDSVKRDVAAYFRNLIEMMAENGNNARLTLYTMPLDISGQPTVIDEDRDVVKRNRKEIFKSISRSLYSPGGDAVGTSLQKALDSSNTKNILILSDAAYEEVSQSTEIQLSGANGKTVSLICFSCTELDTQPVKVINEMIEKTGGIHHVVDNSTINANEAQSLYDRIMQVKERIDSETKRLQGQK